MLCECVLWAIPYRDNFEKDDLQFPKSPVPDEENIRREMTSVCNFTAGEFQSKTLLERCRSVGHFIQSGRSRDKRQSRKSASTDVSEAKQCTRQISPVVDIPGIAGGTSKETYLVPSSCQSICKDYNDLHIAGDQVMPISLAAADLTIDSGFAYAEGPFLQSCQIPPDMETPRPSLEYTRRPPRGDSSCWRVSSIKDKSILQHCRPLANSMLNNYLEQKIMELYKQYMVDSMLNSNSPTKIMASELILTNVDQITQQISREQNMETNKAKDMVISCLLKVASGMQSSELSTPQLQISSDHSLK
ncbi:UNVERIFIED_CONTAM: hypothetical protein FKN15_001397 [Acipenser sinensis]